MEHRTESSSSHVERSHKGYGKLNTDKVQLRYHLKSTYNVIRSHFIRSLGLKLNPKACRTGNHKSPVRATKHPEISLPLPREVLASGLKDCSTSVDYSGAPCPCLTADASQATDFRASSELKRIASDNQPRDGNKQINPQQKSSSPSPNATEERNGDQTNRNDAMVDEEESSSAGRAVPSSSGPRDASGRVCGRNFANVATSSSSCSHGVESIVTTFPALVLDNPIADDEVDEKMIPLREVAALISGADQKQITDDRALKNKLEEIIRYTWDEKDKFMGEMKKRQAAAEEAASEVIRLQGQCNLLQGINNSLKFQREALGKELNCLKKLLFRHGMEVDIAADTLQNTKKISESKSQSNPEWHKRMTETTSFPLKETQPIRKNSLYLEKHTLEKIQLEKRLQKASDEILSLEAKVDIYKKFIIRLHSQVREVERQKAELEQMLIEANSINEEQTTQLEQVREQLEELSHASMLTCQSDPLCTDGVPNFSEKWTLIKSQLTPKLACCRRSLQSKLVDGNKEAISYLYSLKDTIRVVERGIIDGKLLLELGKFLAATLGRNRGLEKEIERCISARQGEKDGGPISS
ncbi:hypothetical protein PRK78_001900 [Emydomyces testavorans]|uniref:Uncharacterized protein n=1 Tax=Emydomyces testavorans TaxID=2070801 RepID=A0AAF0IHB3_9EURO|nr:hypothetical protein PRK78_001900 [Emydomyces testavorans]